VFGADEYCWPVATFNDRIVVGWDRPVFESVDAGDGLYYNEVTGWENGFVQFDLASGDAGLEVSNPSAVDLVQTIVPVETRGAQVMGRIVVEVGDEAKALIESLGASAEKVGRVLSQANYDKVVDARDALDAVIEAATPADKGEKADDDDEPEVLPHTYVGEGNECAECHAPADDPIHDTSDDSDEDDSEKIILTVDDLLADLNL
jgi:hypothetical protein